MAWSRDGVNRGAPCAEGVVWSACLAEMQGQFSRDTIRESLPCSTTPNGKPQRHMLGMHTYTTHENARARAHTHTHTHTHTHPYTNTRAHTHPHAHTRRNVPTAYASGMRLQRATCRPLTDGGTQSHPTWAHHTRPRLRTRRPISDRSMPICRVTAAPCTTALFSCARLTRYGSTWG